MLPPYCIADFQSADPRRADGLPTGSRRDSATRRNRNQSSAGFQPAVSRISNPLASRRSDGLPTGSRRYSRLEICATPSSLAAPPEKSLRAATIRTATFPVQLCAIWVTALPRWPNGRPLAAHHIVYLLAELEFEVRREQLPPATTGRFCGVSWRPRRVRAVDKVVAQVSQPAVSQCFQPADAAKAIPRCCWGVAADWKSAIQQVGKPV